MEVSKYAVYKMNVMRYFGANGTAFNGEIFKDFIG